MALSVCPSGCSGVRSVVHISSKNCGLGCSNLVCTLHMESERSLYIFKVKGQISTSLGLYKELWHLDPCRQDIERTMQSRLLKLSMYTLYGKGKKPIYFQGQRSNFKVTGPLQNILALRSLWAGYSKNYAVAKLLKPSIYTLFIFKVKDQISRSLNLYKKCQHLDPCGQACSLRLKLSMYTS